MKQRPKKIFPSSTFASDELNYLLKNLLFTTKTLKPPSNQKNCGQSSSEKFRTQKNRGQLASEKFRTQKTVDNRPRKNSEHKNPWTIGFGKIPNTKIRGQFSSGVFPECFVHVQLAPEFFRSALYTHNSSPEVFRSALYTYNSSPEVFRSALYTYNSGPEVFRSALYTYNSSPEVFRSRLHVKIEVGRSKKP